MVIVIVATLSVTVFSLQVRGFYVNSSPWSPKAMPFRPTVGARHPLGRHSCRTYVLKGFFEYVRSYVAHVMAWNYVSDLRVSIYEHLQKLSLRYYSDKQTGEIMSRVVNDTQHIEPLIAHNIPDLDCKRHCVVGHHGNSHLSQPDARFADADPHSHHLAGHLAVQRSVRSAFRAAQAQFADLNAVLQDNISGIKEIQIFTREPYERGRVAERSEGYTVKLLRALKLLAVYHPSVEFAASLGTIIVLFFGGRAALQGQLPLEDLVAFMLYLSMFYQPVTILARMNEQVQMALAGADRVAEVLDVESDVVEALVPSACKRAQGRIVFENVCFAYQEGIPVLEDISFTIEPGETLALVGPTGVGKSTVASLIPRFYDPTSGRITLDGIDLRDLELQSLRRNISIVLQDVFLFNGTVRENIMYGAGHASPEEVEAAARIANAHDFIMELPDGYDTHIGERGVRLSGGQKQRLAIARAVLKDAPILILDEATSAVDVETELQIQQALNNLMRGKTAIVIAHRPVNDPRCRQNCRLGSRPYCRNGQP